MSGRTTSGTTDAYGTIAFSFTVTGTSGQSATVTVTDSSYTASATFSIP